MKFFFFSKFAALVNGVSDKQHYLDGFIYCAYFYNTTYLKLKFHYEKKKKKNQNQNLRVRQNAILMPVEIKRSFSLFFYE